MSDLDLRQFKRYQLAAPVNYWWPTPEGPVQAGHGITRDISNNGVMVIARECPPKDARIQMTIYIDPQKENNPTLKLHGEGTVVRVQLETREQPSQEGIGFAASVYFYSERSNDSEEMHRVEAED